MPRASICLTPVFCPCLPLSSNLKDIHFFKEEGEFEMRGKKKCKHCRKLFTPDRRVWNRQTTCRSAVCQRQRKKSNNQAFKEKNPDYWKGRYDYIKKWRQENPDYQQEWRLEKKEEEKKKSFSEIQAEKAGYYNKNPRSKLRGIQRNIHLF